MAFPIPSIQIGSSRHHHGLSVFPLFAEMNSPVEYILADEAIAAKSVVVEEISQSGSVPELLVENNGDVPVLFIEGEQLVGAKQNRVLNTSILIPAHTKVKVPVSCVEQGRWRHVSTSFDASQTVSGATLRSALKSSVTHSLRATQTHQSDQSSVWYEVSRQQTSLGVSSETMCMMDTYNNYAEEIRAYIEELPYPDGAVGLAVGVGPRVVAMDLFDKPATCEKMWKRLLSGFVLQAIEAKDETQAPTEADVETFWQASAQSSWENAAAVGQGEEFRSELANQSASALLVENATVHYSVVTSGK